VASEREAELLRQILASQDLAPRSVYADELQQRGDPRGEFIARQLAGDPARALIDRHASTWWPGIPARRIGTRAGFVERIAGTAKEVEAALQLAEPIRDVELVDMNPDAIARVDFQRFTRVAANGFLHNIVAALRTSRIATLELGRCEFDRRKPWTDELPACRALSLAHDTYAGRDLPSLLGSWHALPELVRLDLSGTTLTPEVLAALLKLDLRSLVHLRLSDNPLGAAGARVLIDHLPPALVDLEVVKCGFGEAELAELRGRLRVAYETPAAIAIDLVGSTLELRRVTADRWAFLVDGQHRAVRWQAIARDDRQGFRVLQTWQMAEHAPLDKLADALAAGEPRQLTANGCTVDLGSQTGYVYNSSVFEHETARIEYELRGSTIAVTFESYTSID
jgi:uncharacterized protein (TIGR02996 family)